MKDIYVLIGAPGSGKSTWAQKHFGKASIISSDDVREYMYGDAQVQGNPWPVVYAILESKLASDLNPIVFDATNVKRKDRRRLINFIRTHVVGEFNLHGVVFSVEKKELLRRNEIRDKPVPKDVIDRMMSSLKGGPPTKDEGFTYLDEV